MSELPLMQASSYAHTHHNVADVGHFANQAIGSARLGANADIQYLQQQAARIPQPLPKKGTPMTSRRVVQVFIVDTYESVPLKDCVIYQGEQKLTDLTDQELFFEIDIKSLLDTHNEKRVKMIDKRVKERTEYLEPARIRDLKMTVVTVATF